MGTNSCLFSCMEDSSENKISGSPLHGILDVTLEELGEMFEGYSAEMCAGKAKGLACVFFKCSERNACAAHGTNVVATVLGIVFLLHIRRDSSHIFDFLSEALTLLPERQQ